MLIEKREVVRVPLSSWAGIMVPLNLLNYQGHVATDVGDRVLNLAGQEKIFRFCADVWSGILQTQLSFLRMAGPLPSSASDTSTL